MKKKIEKLFENLCCSQCRNGFDEESITIKRQEEGLSVVKLECKHCGKSFGVAFLGLSNIDVKNWFLAPTDDLRSSNMLEIVASEFKVQGLEIDYALVIWESDYRHDGSGFSFREFRKGHEWGYIRNVTRQNYLKNAYRVLLTRARQGMVICVPKGNANKTKGGFNPSVFVLVIMHLCLATSGALRI